MKEKSNKKRKKKDYQAKSKEKMLSIYLLTIKRNQRLLLEYLWTIYLIYLEFLIAQKMFDKY